MEPFASVGGSPEASKSGASESEVTPTPSTRFGRAPGHGRTTSAGPFHRAKSGRTADGGWEPPGFVHEGHELVLSPAVTALTSSRTSDSSMEDQPPAIPPVLPPGFNVNPGSGTFVDFPWLTAPVVPPEPPEPQAEASTSTEAAPGCVVMEPGSADCTIRVYCAEIPGLGCAS